MDTAGEMMTKEESELWFNTVAKECSRNKVIGDDIELMYLAFKARMLAEIRLEGDEDKIEGDGIRPVIITGG